MNSQVAIEQERLALQTDLFYLCQTLYAPPGHYWSESVHRTACNFFVRKNPVRPLAQQDKVKQRLYLDPRNHFKTTIDICDAVQWILCFPDVRILLATGTRENGMRMLQAVKAHFQYNPIIRSFFPELCPSDKSVEHWGTQDSFVCPARKNKALREPTVAIASPESTVAGMHYDVLKFDDLVNETNSRSADTLRSVNTWYKLTNPLLEPYGYRDVIGTRYDFSDLYGEILGDDYDDRDVYGEMIHGYSVLKRACYTSDGSLLFPERFTVERLQAERDEMGSFLFSAQYLNRPVPSDSATFPISALQKAIVKLTSKDNGPRFTTLDLAMSQASDADRTAFVTCRFVPRGAKVYETCSAVRVIVEDIQAGHFTPEQIVTRLFEAHRKFRPTQIRTEDVAFSRLLESIIKAESAKRGIFLPFVWIKRDTRIGKDARIAALQPWLERGDLQIADTCPQREDLILELTRFPKYRLKDIADALADQLENVQNFIYRDTGSTEQYVPSGDARIGLL